MLCDCIRVFSAIAALNRKEKLDFQLSFSAEANSPVCRGPPLVPRNRVPIGFARCLGLVRGFCLFFSVRTNYWLS